ncbi:ribonuclease HI family protein [Chloroflexota bacterium]
MNNNTAFIWVDGASRGNPGPASIAAVIKDTEGTTHATISRAIGITTNNQAEYQAVIAAFEKAAALGATSVKLHSDSELVIKQITGKYRVKNTSLIPLHRKILDMAARFTSFSAHHVPREQNREADALANQAFDRLK